MQVAQLSTELTPWCLPGKHAVQCIILFRESNTEFVRCELGTTRSRFRFRLYFSEEVLEEGASEGASQIKSHQPVSQSSPAPNGPSLAVSLDIAPVEDDRTLQDDGASKNELEEAVEGGSKYEEAVEDDSEDDWEDNSEDEDGGTSKDKSLFKRISLRAHLTTRESLITAALTAAASKSSPDSNNDSPPTKTNLKPIAEISQSGPLHIIQTTGIGYPTKHAPSPRTTRRNVANLKQYPDKIHMGKEGDKMHANWNQIPQKC